MLVIENNYNKKIAPFRFSKEQMKIIPVQVNISIAVLDILHIEEVKHEYTPKIRLTMEWYDYRLIYHNLKTRRSANTLGIEELEKNLDASDCFPEHKEQKWI